MVLSPTLITSRFIIRPLNASDVSERYVAWFSDSVTRQYITSATMKPTVADLKEYVIQRSCRDDVLFLGIFELNGRAHIGNIKYEPINSQAGYAIMGILIGEPSWRGKGVAAEVLLASAQWLSQYRNIKQVVLGVSRTNTLAILAYQKVGFIEEVTDLIQITSEESMAMIWHLHSRPS